MFISGLHTHPGTCTYTCVQTQTYTHHLRHTPREGWKLSVGLSKEAVGPHSVLLDILSSGHEGLSLVSLTSPSFFKCEHVPVLSAAHYN